MQSFLGVVVDGRAQVFEIAPRTAPVATLGLISPAALSGNLCQHFALPPFGQPRDAPIELLLVDLTFAGIVHEDR